MTLIELFVLLQVLDFLTTLIGLRMGGAELNPFIAQLMQITDPVMGLMLAKVVGFGLGGYCVWRQKTQIIRWINYVFAILVLWNAANIMVAVT